MNNKYKYHISEKEREELIGDIKLKVGLFGCLCFFYVVRQYNNFSLIGLDFILKTYTILGIVFTILLYKIDKEYEKNDYNFVFIFFQKFLTYGSIFVAFFLVTNEYLSNNKEYVISTLILEKKEKHGKRSSNTITVNIEGIEREININNYSFEGIKKSNYANIKIKKGFWNSPILIETKLIIRKMEINTND